MQVCLVPVLMCVSVSVPKEDYIDFDFVKIIRKIVRLFSPKEKHASTKTSTACVY